MGRGSSWLRCDARDARRRKRSNNRARRCRRRCWDTCSVHRWCRCWRSWQTQRCPTPSTSRTNGTGRHRRGVGISINGRADGNWDSRRRNDWRSSSDGRRCGVKRRKQRGSIALSRGDCRALDHNAGSVLTPDAVPDRKHGHLWHSIHWLCRYGTGLPRERICGFGRSRRSIVNRVELRLAQVRENNSRSYHETSVLAIHDARLRRVRVRMGERVVHTREEVEAPLGSVRHCIDPAALLDNNVNGTAKRVKQKFGGRVEVLGEKLFTSRKNTCFSSIRARVRRCAHLVLQRVLHGEWPEACSVRDLLTSMNFANEIHQTNARRCLDVADEHLAIRVKPVTIRRCHFERPTHVCA